MKRAAIFILCAFYLLLNSGMYLCAVHCSVEKLVAKPSAQMACTKPCCKQANSCREQDCSKKHGSFTIKENVKPGYQIRFNLPLLTLQHLPFAKRTQQHPLVPVQDNRLANAKAPPDRYGKSIPIQYRSLLI